jgi:hypothetical protein
MYLVHCVTPLQETTLVVATYRHRALIMLVVVVVDRSLSPRSQVMTRFTKGDSSTSPSEAMIPPWQCNAGITRREKRW